MLCSLSVRERWLVALVCFLVVYSVGKAYEQRCLEQAVSELKLIAVEVRLFNADTGEEIWDTSTPINYRVIQDDKHPKQLFIEGPRSVSGIGRFFLRFASTHDVEVEFGAEGYESKQIRLDPSDRDVRVNLSRMVAHDQQQRVTSIVRTSRPLHTSP